MVLDCTVMAYRKYDSLAERFWVKVAVSEEPDGCWPWTAAVNNSGYGLFRLPHGNERAHRMAWRLTQGEIPKGMWVCHHCDNRRCVRPSHLFLGDPQANVDDMIAKDRGRYWNRNKTHCIRGHPLDAQNTYRRGPNRRGCKECRRAACRDCYWRSRGRRRNEGSGK